MENSKIKILHVSKTYFPEEIGGIEVYVHGLIHNIAKYGFSGAVAAPGKNSYNIEYDGVSVNRYAFDKEDRMEYAYSVPDKIAASEFVNVINKVDPSIIHLHYLNSRISSLLLDIAHDRGIKTVFTYHGAAPSCLQQAMLLNGVKPCDGRMEYARCVRCYMMKQGISPTIARSAATLPIGISRPLARLPLHWPFSRFRVPGLIAEFHAHFRAMLAKVDHVVAICDWGADVLRRNGVCERKLSLSRLGITYGDEPTERHVNTYQGPAIRMAFFGRLDKLKGVDLIPEALQQQPDAPIEVDLYLIRQSGDIKLFKRIEDYALKDKRIRIHPPAPPSAVRSTMARYDFLVVPSRVLEGGPLVVLEAFSIGVPVLGARLGAIAELVRDGIDGLLFEAEDASALADTFRRIVDDPTIINRLRSGIGPVRTMRDVASDMAHVYRTLLSSTNDI